MKKRSTEILQRLLDTPTHLLPEEVILSDYDMSDKTLRLDIREANAFTQSVDVSSKISLADGSIYLEAGFDYSQITDALSTMDLFEYKLSSEERKIYITVELLLQEGYISLQALADSMFVSRNTVVQDIKLVRYWLSKYDIEVITKGKYGVEINSSEEKQRVLLVDIFFDLLSSRYHAHDYFSGLLERKLGFSYSIDDILGSVRMFETKFNTFLTVESEYRISASLLISFNQLKNKNDVDIQTVTQDSSFNSLDFVGQLIVFVAKKINNLGAFNSERIGQIEQFIFNQSHYPQVEHVNDFDFYCTVSHFLTLIGIDLGIDLQNDELLIDLLVSHLKSLINWDSDSFNANIAGPLGPQVKLIRQATTRNLNVIENFLHRPLSDSMVSSIVIHIAAAVLRNENKKTPSRIAIVCPGSRAMSEYLQEQIKNYFNFYVACSIQKNDFNFNDLETQHLDFVVTTVDLPQLTVPSVKVSPMLTISDINNIQAIAFKIQHDSKQNRKDNDALIQLVSPIVKSGNIRKMEIIYNQTVRLLKEFENSEYQTAMNSEILKIMPMQFIRIESRSLSWEDGIKAGFTDLVENNLVGPSYVDHAIDNVEKYGPYIIINRGIALPHAESKDDVLEDCLSLLISQKGIEFDNNERVFLLFCFAQNSDIEYLRLFKEIMSLGNRQTGINRLIKSQTSEQAQRILIEMLTNYKNK